MTKLPQWKKTQAGNPMLSFWGLRVIVFPLRNGRWNYNVLGMPTGVVWGPTFADDCECRDAAEDAFLRYKLARDWATPGKAKFRESLRDGSRDPWLREQEAKADADVESLARGGR